MSEAQRARRVVMLLLNPYTHDSRVEKEAATLVDAGYRVTILALAAHGLPQREIRDGVSVIRVRRPNWPPLLRFFIVRRRMARLLRASRPDVVHAHDTETLDIAGGVARDLGVPIVYDAHELWLERVRRDRTAVYAALTRWYFGRVERRYVPRASGWITVSAPIADHLRRAYDLPEVLVLPNYPLADDDAAEPRDLRGLPGAERIPVGAPIVLFIGNATEGRGIEPLVAAVAAIPGAHLVLLGAGDQEAFVDEVARRHGVAERVHATPRVPPDHVVSYAASATVGVSPIPPASLSYRYSLPNKLFQYMQAGLPVVASDFPQVREVVGTTGAGITVDPRDAVALADAIRTYLSDQPRRAADGGRGRDAVRERFNWSKVAGGLVELYRRVGPAEANP